jgi:hypothetical protein
MKTKDYVKCENCGEKINISKELQEVRQESVLNLREKEKIINDLKGQLGDALRKAESGSVQLRGEIQELEIISLLKDLYPHDEITQSKKGSNAADVMQVVKLPNGTVCGKIYYESKRTKSWSNEWVEKLKKDNLSAKADILVLVTNALPKGMNRYGIKDNIWITQFDDFKELTLALRYGLIKLHAISIIQENRNTKMSLLYNYLTSIEFKNVFQAILDGLKKIKESHESEKVKTQSFWKEREKMMEQVLTNSIEFYASIKGIAGTAIPQIKMLEAPQAD